MKYELINFCEIDKFAIDSYCRIHNEPSSKNLGDISKVNTTDIQDFDLLVGGSPCQDFSLAGKKSGATYTCTDCGYQYNPLEAHYTQRNCCPKCGSQNLEKTRSSLIVEYLRILREKQPKFAIYENVKNIIGKEFKPIFDLFLKEVNEIGYVPYYQVLNAKYYGIPQNRERVIAVFIRKDIDHGFTYPEKITLKSNIEDVLDDKIDKKYYLKEDTVFKIIQTAINNHKLSIYFHTKHASNLFTKISSVILKYERNSYGKQIRKQYEKGEIHEKIKNMKILVPRNDGISNTLTTFQKDNYILERWIFINEKLSNYLIDYYWCNHKLPSRINLRTNDVFIYGENDKDLYYLNETLKIALICFCKNYGYCVRKLTPRESFRLMGFKDEYFEKARYYTDEERNRLAQLGKKYLTELNIDGKECAINLSDTQAYKQAGNSIVVDVLYYVFQSLKEQYSEFTDGIKVCSLFSGIGAFEQALKII